jgi:hypothetical protein
VRNVFSKIAALSLTDLEYCGLARVTRSQKQNLDLNLPLLCVLGRGIPELSGLVMN